MRTSPSPRACSVSPLRAPDVDDVLNKVVRSYEILPKNCDTLAWYWARDDDRRVLKSPEAFMGMVGEETLWSAFAGRCEDFRGLAEAYRVAEDGGHRAVADICERRLRSDDGRGKAELARVKTGLALAMRAQGNDGGALAFEAQALELAMRDPEPRAAVQTVTVERAEAGIFARTRQAFLRLLGSAGR